MKKKFIGALAALALTVSMASPVLAATETYSTQAAKTSTSTPGAEVETLTDTSSKQIETLSTNVATDASKYVDSSKTVATAPTLAVEIINNGIAPGDTTTEWTLDLVNEELGNGTYLVAHIKADGSTEYQVVTAVNGKVSLTLHGASPLAFYAITAKAAGTTTAKTAATATAASTDASPKTADAFPMALAVVLLSGSAITVVSRKKVTG